MKISYDNTMIATPTHRIKHYCVQEFVTNTMSSFPPYHRIDGWWVVCANSRRFDCQPYLTLRGPAVIHLDKLPQDHYDNRAAIHRRIVATMNQLREIFLAGNRQWFLSLESDVILTGDILRRMMSRINDTPEVKCLHTNCYPGFMHGVPPVFTKVKKMTLGCTLIHRDILQDIEFRFDPDMLAAFHDAYFLKDLKKLGHDVYYDPAIQPRHVNQSSCSRGWDALNPKELRT